MSNTSQSRILVHQDNPIVAFTKAEAYYVLTGRTKYFTDGTRIDVIMLPKSERAFIQIASTFGMHPIQFQRVLTRVAKRYRARITYVDSQNLAVSLLRANRSGITISTIVEFGTKEVRIVE